jgi:hypothetical protein
MNDSSDNSGRQTVISLGNSTCSRSLRSASNRVVGRNRVALSSSLAPMALALAGLGKVCLHGRTAARIAVLACADGTAPIGTYHANRPPQQGSLGLTNPQAKAVDPLTGQVIGPTVALAYLNGTPITRPGTKTAANPAGEPV